MILIRIIELLITIIETTKDKLTTNVMSHRELTVKHVRNKNITQELINLF